MEYRRAWKKCVWVAGWLSLLSWTVWGGTPGSSLKIARDRIGVVEQGAQVDRPFVVAAYGKLPLSFEQNTGQADSRVKFLSRGQGYGLLLTGTEAVLALRSGNCDRGQPAPNTANGKLAHSAPCIARKAAVHLRLVGSNPHPSVSGIDRLPGQINYFIGNDPAQWHTNVPNYSKVRYRDVYPGIDVVYYGNQRQLEFDLVVAPGAEPGKIRFRLSGARKLSLNALGDLVIRTGSGDVSLHKPAVYQASSTGKEVVEGHYVLEGRHEIAFEVGPFDRSKPLVVDPTLSYATFIGGTGTDAGTAIAVDSSGNAYIAGTTVAAAGGPEDFPTLNPFATSGTIFVSKLNPSGSALVYSSYFGGGGPNGPGIVATSCGEGQCLSGLAIDSSGAVYLTGKAFVGFPTVNQISGACNSHCQSVGGSFVAKINATGSAIDYASMIGGVLSSAIAVDSSGNAYVVGTTYIASDFPVVNAYQSTFGGGSNDAFLLKVNAAGSALVYSTFLGGTGADQGTGVAVDSSGNAYVAGTSFTLTGPSSFPTVNQISAACVETCQTGSGHEIAFITKFNAAGSALVYSSLLGWSGNTNAAGGGTALQGAGLAIDSSGNAYVAGSTVPLSGSTNDFPTTSGAFQTTPTCSGNPCSSGFITKVNAAGDALVYSTLLGGGAASSGAGGIQDISVDSFEDVAVIGTFGQSFPLVKSLFPNYAPLDSAIAVLNPTGSSLLFSSNLDGSSGGPDAIGVTFDSAGSAYITGSACNALPITGGAFQTTCKGTTNAFVAKIALNLSAPAASLSPATLAFTSQTVGTSSAAQSVTLNNTGNATLNITGISITGADLGDYSQTDTCGTSVAAGASCNISVTFKPTASGTRTASVSIADNAKGSPQTIALTGTGAVAAPVVSLAPPTGLTFASQTVGTTSAGQNITLTNTGNASLNVTGITITGTNAGDYSQTNTCVIVAPSAFCTISVTFKPTATGMRTASVSIADNAAGSPQTVLLTGTGAAATPTLTLTPTSLTFSSQTVGTSSTAQTVTLSNTGTAALSVTGITVTGANAGDYSEADTCGANVAANVNCTISIIFKPTAPGTRMASVSIGDNAGGSPQTVSLTGTAAAATAPAVTLSPTSLTFASETIGSSGTAQSITLTNSGTAALSITGITVSGPNSGDFSETNSCGAGVAPSAPCSISVIFKPAAAGTRTASVSIADNAGGSPQTVSLTGTGAAPAQDFSIAASPASVTVIAGSSGTSTLTVTPSNGFNQAVSFACSGLPSLATCTFSPATVTPNGSAATTTITVATTATTTTGMIQTPANGASGSHMTMALAGLAACLFSLGGMRRRRHGWLWVLVIIAGLGLLSACGSSKKTTQGTSPGTYTVTVTATSGTGNSALSHNASVSLTVQ